MDENKLMEIVNRAVGDFGSILTGALVLLGDRLDLCVAGIMATFGWEKALGDEDELRWWERAVSRAVQRQGLAIAAAAT